MKSKTQLKNIAGIGVGSGKKESFYFCAFQFFENENRWFLKNCQRLKDVMYPDTEDHLLTWINDYGIDVLMVDFPLSGSVCDECKLVCPGSLNCPVKGVVEVRAFIAKLLEEDLASHLENPKEYEKKRNEQDVSLLSKSLKRKLKKGFIPYWHRLTDIDIWLNYHDDLLKYFKTSYDSFGNENTPQIMRFNYLKRHFPKSLRLFETNYHILMLEFLKAKIVSEKNIRELTSLDSAPLARLDIIETLEKKFNIFIYEKDKETLVKKPRAFKSFIIGLSAIQIGKESGDQSKFLDYDLAIANYTL